MPLLGISKEMPIVKPRENAPVFKKLHKGVHLDVSSPDDGVWPKIQYNAAQMQAIAEAGFDSVRVFIPYGADASSTGQL